MKKYKLIPVETYEDMTSWIEDLKSMLSKARTEIARLEINETLTRKNNTATIETMRNQIFALSDALSEIIESIGCSPNEGCSKDCEHCENYHRVSIKYRNLITEINSIESVPPYYDEEDYGGYCTRGIK